MAFCILRHALHIAVGRSGLKSLQSLHVFSRARVPVIISKAIPFPRRLAAFYYVLITVAYSITIDPHLLADLNICNSFFSSVLLLSVELISYMLNTTHMFYGLRRNSFMIFEIFYSLLHFLNTGQH